MERHGKVVHLGDRRRLLHRPGAKRLREAGNETMQLAREIGSLAGYDRRLRFWRRGTDLQKEAATAERITEFAFCIRSNDGEWRLLCIDNSQPWDRHLPDGEDFEQQGLECVPDLVYFVD